MTCKNCGHNFNNIYCGNCGQKSDIRRVNLSYLISEISNNIFQVNHGMFYTIKELFIRPGHSIREFLNGKRKSHLKPLNFVLLVSGIYVFITYFTSQKIFLEDFLSGIIAVFNEREDEIKLSRTLKLLTWMSNNFNYSTLLLLPFFSFASYITFLKNKYNYFEHLVLNIYITGQQIIFYLVFSLLFFVFKTENYFTQIVPIIISVLFVFWTFIQFFEKEKTLTKIILTISTYILYFFSIMFFIFFIGIIEMIIN